MEKENMVHLFSGILINRKKLKTKNKNNDILKFASKWIEKQKQKPKEQQQKKTK